MLKLMMILSALLLGTTASAKLDPASVHGMLIVGHDTIYASHLPMFHNPHDYQVILEIDLGEKAKGIYLANQQDGVYFTLAPEAFVLPDLLKGKTSFQASLYKGHFERGGTEIAKIQVQVKSIVHFEKLNPKLESTFGGEYVIFGQGSDVFLFHPVGRKPNFDHVLKVSSLPSGSALTEALQKSKTVSLNLQEVGKDEPTTATQLTSIDHGESFSVKEIYLEFSDLSH